MTISFNAPYTKLVFLILFTYFSSLSKSFSQSSELGIVLGGGVAYGDIELKPSATFQQTRPVAGIFYRHTLSDRWGLRGQLTLAQFSANEKKYPVASFDNYRERRGIAFTTSLLELSILPEFRLFSISSVDFYAFTGVGGFYFKPSVNFNEPNPVLGDKLLDKNAVFSKFSWAIPVGGGMRWSINEQTNFGFEISGRKTGTDYIDGVSLMANPRIRDYYFLANFTASTLIGGNGRRQGRQTSGCPRFD